GTIFYLFLLALVNAALRRWRPAAALRPAEFGLIYAITTVSAAIGSADEAMQVWPMMVFPFRASQDLIAGPFRRFIPHWLAPQSRSVVESYYVGGIHFWQRHLLVAWMVPLLSWMSWLLAVGATMWSWNVILRRRWIDQDRLSFPCAQLPLEICRAGGFGGLLSGRLFWAGLILAALVESLAQTSARFPAVPDIPLDFNATPVLGGAPEPWNALAPMHLTWSTVHLGVCYFIPLDIL